LNAKQKLSCWGSNVLGTIGNGTHGWNGKDEDRNLAAESVVVPFDAYNLPSLNSVACARGRTCVVTVAGGVWCWGAFGDDIVDTPQEQKLPSAVGQMVVGAHSCAAMDDKSLWCWGANAFGQLGIGTRADAKQPQRVEGLGEVTAVAVSESATCAIDTAKTVWCWGSNQVYELLDEGPDQTKPWRTSLRDAEEIAAGASHFCVKTTQKTINCWGNNFERQLGVEDSRGRQGPTAPAVGAKAASPFSMALGFSFSSVLTADGGVVSWGGNKLGQLGAPPSQVPTSVGVRSALNRVVEVAATTSHVCALKSDETVWCWGAGQDYQLGNGRAENSSVPVKVNLSAL